MTSIDASQISAISRFFSSSVIRQMARKGRSPLFARLLRESLLHKVTVAPCYVYELFDTAFDILKKKAHRHEYIYKAALTHKILLGAHSLQTASMLTEFRVGACKADLAILNGTATVYEIKSERDSLSRLERQIESYKQVFAKVYVIAGENHVDEILNTVSPDVGVLVLQSRYQISERRKADDRPERTNSAAIFDAIRLSEAKQILQRSGVEIPRVSNIELHKALRAKFVTLPPRDAHEGMVRILKKSRDLLPLADLVKSLPRSLQSAALSVPLRRSDHDRLLNAVNARIQDAMKWA
ncbi:MAG: sce7726 family protein [Alphaproteobacteria bacterium]|nr:sce7726 family protein [Alphaproteobacteria bacterium]